MNRRQLLRTLSGSAGLACAASGTAPLLAQAQAAKPQGSSASVNSRAKLVAHWGLDGDAKDKAGINHGEAKGITYVEGVDGSAGGAALFNGVDSVIEVPDAEALNFASEPFSIAMWVKPNEDIESALGDLACKFDASLRRGFNLTLLGSSSGYSSYGDRKGVHFGVDNGISGTWQDCGRPWRTNPIITTLTVHQGKLYAGIGDASRSEDACRLFRYEGPDQWVDCGRIGNHPLTMTAMSTAVHKGELYVGTGTWDWDRSNIGIGGQNRVYRYEGGTKWRDCGAVGNGYCTMSLASFKGALYAADDNVKCYRFDGDKSWEYCGTADLTSRLNCLMPYHGSLYGATHGFFYRYDGGTKWECIGRNPFGVTQTHKMQVFGGRLYAGTWPHGKVLRYEGGSEWTDMGQLGIATDEFQINEINDLQVYNGKFYAGVIPKAEVYRFESMGNWTMMRTLLQDPSYNPRFVDTWSRVTSMAEYQGRLFQGTSNCYGRYEPNNPPETGRVYAMDAGRCVSYDEDLGGTWRHVVAVRERTAVKLYVDGKLYATSPAFVADDYMISNRELMTIGFGANGYLAGALDDILIFRGVLEQGQVLDLFKARGA